MTAVFMSLLERSPPKELSSFPCISWAHVFHLSAVSCFIRVRLRCLLVNSSHILSDDRGLRGAESRRDLAYWPSSPGRTVFGRHWGVRVLAWAVAVWGSGQRRLV